ncbi:MAG: RsmD family RNA methyltransferase, partial [Dehalococcoidia bacterium]
MRPKSSMRVVGGVAKGRRLKGAMVPGVRPTTERARAAIFNVLSPDSYLEGRVLDLFAGTGSLGIEGLSQGAAWADFVERDRRQCEVIRSNLETTGFTDQSKVYCGDAHRLLRMLTGPYRLALLDPPYRMPDLSEFMEQLAATPGLLEEGGIVVVGHSHRLTLRSEYGELH